MAKKNFWGIPVMVLVLSSASCAVLDGLLKPAASEELPNPYEVQQLETIKDIDGDIKSEKLNLIDLPQGVKHKDRDGKTVEQISVLKSSSNGKTVYLFMTEYPRHCLHIKIDDTPSVEVVSNKMDGNIVLTNTLFPIPSAMLKSLKRCKTLVLQAENVKYKNETVDYKSAVMTVETAAIKALQKLLE